MTPLAIPGAFICAAAALLFLAIRESNRLRVRIGDAHSNRLANAQDVDWAADAETPVASIVRCGKDSIAFAGDVGDGSVGRIHQITRNDDGSLSVRPWPPEAA
jgi:hypothetical protein